MTKYSLQNFRTLLQNPTAVVGEIRALGLNTNRFYHKNYLRNDGEHIYHRDWDNLLILEGCRYDLFENLNTINGDLSPFISRGSTSAEFLKENFSDDIFHDIVYVTANPYVHKVDDGTFHKIYNLLETDWNEDVGTVLPESIVEKTIKAHKEHPNKRLLVHFMQPDYPFIGPLGQDIGHRGYGDHSTTTDDNKYTIWGKLQYNLDGITEEVVWEAYRENLELVLPHAEELIERINGKTVISSDHGNLVGDRLWPVPVKGYGHPGSLRVEELTKVPWLELECKSRREIVSEPPSSETQQNNVPEKKLEALGYL